MCCRNPIVTSAAGPPTVRQSSVSEVVRKVVFMCHMRTVLSFYPACKSLNKPLLTLDFGLIFLFFYK